MADALLSPAVGVTMSAVSVGCIAYAIRRMNREELPEKKLPLMAVSGAFIFAAQMINFAIPGTGSSGHIGGGILLAALLGGCPALLTISAVLLIQCLFFADGGLLALGCNIFNMGVIPCLVVYPLLFKTIVGEKGLDKRLSAAAVISVIAGLQLGAFGVVLETAASNIALLPFMAFVLAMLPIHLAIGCIEGMITAAVLGFVHRFRPEILSDALRPAYSCGENSLKKVIVAFAIAALVTGGALSLFASADPDGLEWSMEQVAGTADLETDGEIHGWAERIQEMTAWMPDYDFSGEASVNGTSVAGIAGSLLTFVFVGGVGYLVLKWKKKPMQI